MSEPLPPFSCTYSNTAPEILFGLASSIALTTYQAGKIIFISAQDTEHLVQLPRSYDKPMGLAVDGNKLAIATKDYIMVLRNSPRMAPNYPKQQNTYDALYLPRSIYFTGQIDIHDLYWINEELWAVATGYSCLAKIDNQYSFTPQWSPYFIKENKPSDQCHLNGVAFENGIPKYVTALGVSDEAGGWRERKASGGIVMDVEKNKIICEGLPMPHSPRLYNGQLYVLLSGTGQLARIDLQTGKHEVIRSMDGFVRGMDRIGDYLFIGLSKLRETSKAFQDLPVSKKSVYSGIVIIYLPKMSLAGWIKYENNVDEIYDVRVLAGIKRPGILNYERLREFGAITTPEREYWALSGDDPNNAQNLKAK